VTDWDAAFVLAVLLLNPAYWEMENEGQNQNANISIQSFA